MEKTSLPVGEIAEITFKRPRFDVLFRIVGFPIGPHVLPLAGVSEIDDSSQKYKIALFLVTYRLIAGMVFLKVKK